MHDPPPVDASLSPAKQRTLAASGSANEEDDDAGPRPDLAAPGEVPQSQAKREPEEGLAQQGDEVDEDEAQRLLRSPSALTSALVEHRRRLQNHAAEPPLEAAGLGSPLSTRRGQGTSAPPPPPPTSPLPSRASATASSSPSTSATDSSTNPSCPTSSSTSGQDATNLTSSAPPVPASTSSTSSCGWPSQEVEVAVRFFHPLRGRRVVLRSMLPLQREMSATGGACFDYITVGQLLRELAGQGAIDLDRWQVELPDGVDADDGDGADESTSASALSSSSTPSSSSPLPRASRRRYVPLEVDAEGTSAGDPHAERLPLSVMWLPRGGGVQHFIDIRLAARNQGGPSAAAADEAATLSSTEDAAEVVKLGREGRAWMFGRDWNRTAHFRPCLFKDISVLDVSVGSSHFLALTSTPLLF